MRIKKKKREKQIKSENKYYHMICFDYEFALFS